MGRLALEGIRVLNLTAIWAGPLAGALLADMGAEVIKVESINRMDIVRGPASIPPGTRSNGYPDSDPGERPYNRGVYFNEMNRNNLGITVDLTTAKGLAAFKKLVRISDVVLDNFSARVMKNFGLDYPNLRELNPAIIQICMPALGMTGPWRDYVGNGVMIEQMSGVSSLTGYLDGNPVTASMSYGDPIAGVTSALAVLMALEYRHRTGKGQFIDMSQLESLLPFLGDAIMDYTMNGRVQRPMGNHHRYMAPHGCYRCKGDDKWVTIAVADDREWEAFCRAIGNPAWAKDERFSDGFSRWQHQDELDKLVESWTVERDHYEVMHILQKAGVAAGPVADSSEVMADSHLKERGFLEAVKLTDADVRRLRGMPFKLSKTPGSIRRPAPTLGEHNRYVFGGLLGMTEEELAEMEAEDIIGTKPLGGGGLG